MIGKKHGKATKPGYEITKNNKSQATTGVSAVGALVIVGVLVSGLFLIGSYPQSVLSQEQNMLGEGSRARDTITSANDTTTDSIVLGRNMTNATNDSGGSAAAGGNQSQIRLHLQEALSALRNNDTQGALMHLDIVLNTIGGGVQGNTTTTTTTTGSSIAGSDAFTTGITQGGMIPPVGETSTLEEDNPMPQDSDNNDEDANAASDDDGADDNDNDDANDSNSDGEENTRETDTEEDEEDSDCGGVTVGGTSAADDYGCPPDDDGA